MHKLSFVGLGPVGLCTAVCFASKGYTVTASPCSSSKPNHPYTEANEKIRGGSPLIKGTRMRVVDIAVEHECLNHTKHIKLTQTKALTSLLLMG